jgi:hypothetical protein
MRRSLDQVADSWGHLMSVRRGMGGSLADTAVSAEADRLKNLLIELLNAYRRRRNRHPIGSTRYLELRRLKCFPDIISRAAGLHMTIAAYASRLDRPTSNALTERMVTSILHEYLIQKVPVERSQQGFHQWIIPLDAIGLDDVIEQFMAYLSTGHRVVRVGFGVFHPFLVMRPIGVSEPYAELVDGVFERCDSTIGTEMTVGSDDQLEPVCQDAVARLDNVSLAASLGLPGLTKPSTPRVTPGRLWQGPLRMTQTPRPNFLDEANGHLQPYGEPWPSGLGATLPAVLGTTAWLHVPEDLPIFREAYQEICQDLPRLAGRPRKTFLRSWRRKMLASERQWQDDRIVDYLIALESMLVDSNDELRFRTALYASRVLGDTAEERERVYDIVTTAYRLRSDIVHGRDTDKIAEVADKCERVCIGILMKFLKWGKPVKQVQTMLNKALVRGDGIPNSS